MLCFVLEDMQSLKEFNVENEVHQGVEVQRRLQHARENTVPELWVVNGPTEELVGGMEALNEELNSRKLYDRLHSAGVSYLSPEVDDFW